MDIVTLNEICALINNYFDSGETYSGNISIKDGTLSEQLPFSEGQYIRIQGSSMNDGAYRYNSGNLTDEEFNGRISIMRLPVDFQNLIKEISEWKEKNKDLISGVYQSESFGGYSYSLDTSSGRASIQGTFGNRLSRYRKI